MYGDFIRNKRKECGMTQSELAEKVGVARTTIISWELEKYPPTDLSNIHALEHIFCLESGDLYKKVCGVNPTQPLPDTTPEQGSENAAV